MLCEMVISAANALDNNKTTINNMNVFPVPDGDTGINMTLTMTTVRALENFDGTVSDCAERIANMVLRSARGNSGAILSLFFRGMAKSLKGLESATADDIALAFKKGTEEAYKAVMHPTEGTILTVMRICSEKAAEVKDEFHDDIVGLFAYIVKTAEETLAKTPELLPILKEANVVDAGGYGFVFVLSGMLDALNLSPVIAQNESGAETAVTEADFTDFDTSSIVFAYCTECIVNKSEKYYGEGTATDFLDFVYGIGDSAVFVDAEDFIKLHVHTNHPGQVIEMALKYGEIANMKVENMRLQHSSIIAKESSAEKIEAIGKEDKTESAAISLAPTKEFGFVSVCIGDGIRDTFIDLGADNIIFGGQTMNPSTQDIIDGVNKTPARVVYVLPNNKNIYLVAVQAAEMITDKKVIVLNTKSVPQGISAMISFNPDADEETNTTEMQAAIANVRTAQTTYAVRDTSIDGVKISSGQTIGLLEGSIICSSDDEMECIAAIGDKFTDASFLTVFFGEEVSEEQAKQAEEVLQSHVGDGVEITMLCGGQPIYNYIISAE